MQSRCQDNFSVCRGEARRFYRHHNPALCIPGEARQMFEPHGFLFQFAASRAAHRQSRQAPRQWRESARDRDR